MGSKVTVGRGLKSRGLLVKDGYLEVRTCLLTFSKHLELQFFCCINDIDPECIDH